MTGSVIDLIDTCLRITTNHFRDKPGVLVTSWVEKFWDTAAVNLFKSSVVCELKSLPNSWVISDFESFNVKFKEQLKVVMDGVIADLQQINVDDLGFTEKWLGKLVNDLWGCTALCPFCDEPCCYSNKNHCSEESTNHRCIQHRPEVVKGRHVRPNKDKIVYNCNYNVSQKKPQFQVKGGKPHKYINYKKYFPQWHIDPSVAMDGSQYWLWFAVNFSKELVAHYKLKRITIPPSWHSISYEEAIGSLMSLS